MSGLTALDLGRQCYELTGVRPGDKLVLLLIPHCAELFALQLALAVDGFVPAVLPWPTSRIDPEKYQRNLVFQLGGLPAARLITLPRLAANLGSSLPFPVAALTIQNHETFEKSFGQKFADSSASFNGTADRSLSAQLPSDTLFLQFTGGTTGTQKCVVVTESILEAQLKGLTQTLQFSSADTVVSWLPLYHDMGLIACLWLPSCTGGRSVHISATDWLMCPERLFELVSRYHGTFCWMPNFAYSYMAQRKDSMEHQTHRVDSMRAWISCSEPLRLDSMRAFVDAFEPWGVRAETMQASYAMAETVFAVTQTKAGGFPPTFLRSATAALAPAEPKTELAFSLSADSFVSSGTVLPGTEVRIVAKDGDIQEPGQPGEIQIRSNSMFAGYWGQDGFSSACFTADGWYRSGDYGFLNEGQLFVIGRTKDLIIVAGQNILPEDVESIVNLVPGVYPGRVVAFGVEDPTYGTQALAVVAEIRNEGQPPRPGALEREIRSAVLAGIGVAPRYVKTAPERWIVKSTAGKISRSDTRAKFQDELLGVAAIA